MKSFIIGVLSFFASLVIMIVLLVIPILFAYLGGLVLVYFDVNGVFTFWGLVLSALFGCSISFTVWDIYL